MAQAEANHLYYGDNLDILQRKIRDESVDLIYLDPPFNSKTAFNMIFPGPTGDYAPAQIESFNDTWHWNDTTESSYEDLKKSRNIHVANMIVSWRQWLGHNDMMAYLVMMAVRLLELHRVLRSTGSLYLHCDEVASDYLKLLLDSIFGPRNFRSRITWRRTSAHNDAKHGGKRYGDISDYILYYTKTDKYVFNTSYTPYTQKHTKRSYRYRDSNGRMYALGDITNPAGAARGVPCYEIMGVSGYWRFSKQTMQRLIDEGRIVQTKPGNVPRQKRYLDEMPGVALQNIWVDIDPLSAHAKERLGYPTQKPQALLERILQVSSHVESRVLDPFCGCGTAVEAAQKLGRSWVGVDITHLAVKLVQDRLKSSYPSVQYAVHGIPTTLDGARALAMHDRHQFQIWACAQVNAQPNRVKGADRGIDGQLYFKTDAKDDEKAVVSVKSGKVSAKDIRDFAGAIDQDHAKLGIFLTLEEPTAPMLATAAAYPPYDSPYHGPFPKIQIRTIAALFAGDAPRVPLVDLTRARQRSKAVRPQAPLQAPPPQIPLI